jgi:hypothetical protein
MAAALVPITLWDLIELLRPVSLPKVRGGRLPPGQKPARPEALLEAGFPATLFGLYWTANDFEYSAGLLTQ